VWRRGVGTAKDWRLPTLPARPSAFAAVLVVVSALVYLPMESAFGADRWITFGPFAFQASRLLLYLAYFLVGLRLGAAGLDSGLLARDGELARRWPVWLCAGLASYALHFAVIVTVVLPVVRTRQPLPLSGRLLLDITFVLCCTTISVALIALFRRFAVAHRPVFDSLSASSYGIYLLHYLFVVWLQFALLAVALDPIAKGAIVFAGAVALSWGTTAALRRAPMLARVL
jgi:surface polysaccharide O-acyltransferase-like enzyme